MVQGWTPPLPREMIRLSGGIPLPHLWESVMPRRNRPTTRRPQSIKHAVEDRVARRAVANACEESYRHLPEVTYQGGRVTRITFTDPSYA